MKSTNTILLTVLLSVICFLPGCSSSEETSSTEGATRPQDTQAQKPPEHTPALEVKNPQKIDTLNVDVQNTPKPPYDSRASLPTIGSAPPSGKFSVQIGAYKMPDNAERVAGLAKERFGKSVYTLTLADKAGEIYKVYIGDFTLKDEARKFRDEMVQKYPADYKGAWVSENARN